MVLITTQQNNKESVMCFNEFEWDPMEQNVSFIGPVNTFNLSPKLLKDYKRIEIKYGSSSRVFENREGKVYGTDTTNAYNLKTKTLICLDDNKAIKDFGGTYKYIYETIKNLFLED
jgi:hypothetical protein